MTKHINVVDQNVWDTGYKDYNFHEFSGYLSDFIDNFLDKYKFPENASCFEVGCFPGGFLTHFGKKYNLTVNGVDITPCLDERFINFLKSQNLKIGGIKCGDAFDYINSLSKLGGVRFCLFIRFYRAF